jgi:hypothetical protein
MVFGVLLLRAEFEYLIPLFVSLYDSRYLSIYRIQSFSGRTDPTTGDVQEGATWIYDNIERLATFDVTPYASPGNPQQ